MALRSIGLRGYIGELLVEYWLKEVRYANQPGTETVLQVRPAEIDPKGGPYIDIGVAQNGKMLSVYEIKTQDYALDEHFNVNKALWHLWENPRTNETMISQNKQEYPKHTDFKAYLVLLVPPTQGGRSRLKDYITNVIFFSEIISETDTDKFQDHLIENLTTDGRKDLKELVRICKKHVHPPGDTAIDLQGLQKIVGKEFGQSNKSLKPTP